MQRVGTCCECQGEIYASTEHVCTPTEAQMRLQMFNTMKAAEDAFKAIYEHLTPKDQEPAEQALQEPSKKMGRGYGDIRAVCGRCQGVVAFESYERVPHSEHDTCVCSDGFHTAQLPPDLRSRFEAVHASLAQLAPGTVDRIVKVQDDHRKALAVIAQFFHSTNSFDLNPRREVERLIGIQACSECGGSGWLARDESCRTCGSKGFVTLR